MYNRPYTYTYTYTSPFLYNHESIPILLYSYLYVSMPGLPGRRQLHIQPPVCNRPSSYLERFITVGYRSPLTPAYGQGVACP